MGRSPRVVGPPETAKSVTACGRIAQLVEQLTLNQRVLGSSPSASTTLPFRFPTSLRFAITPWLGHEAGTIPNVTLMSRSF